MRSIIKVIFEGGRNLNSFYYILYNKNKFSDMVL